MIEQILNGEALSSIRTKLNEVINLVNTPVLESLPAVDASKAGRKFWLNGTLWTYAKEGQGILAVGTPWPVKGYREYSAKISQSGTNAPEETNVHVNELGTVTLTRESEGLCKVSNQVIRSTDSVFISSWSKQTEAVIANVENGNVEVKSNSFAGVNKDGIFIYIQIKVYLPSA